MSALQAAKAHYEDLQKRAARTASQTLRLLGIELHLLHYSRRVDVAIADQWEGKSHWSWSEIARRFKEPKSFCMAMWTTGEELVGMTLMVVGSGAVTIKFVEGRPNDSCLYKGKRALIALEVATNYAQACGLNELRIHPVNDALAELYQGVYGFELVKPRREEPYYRKRI